MMVRVSDTTGSLVTSPQTTCYAASIRCAHDSRSLKVWWLQMQWRVRLASRRNAEDDRGDVDRTEKAGNDELNMCDNAATPPGSLARFVPVLWSRFDAADEMPTLTAIGRTTTIPHSAFGCL